MIMPINLWDGVDYKFDYNLSGMSKVNRISIKDTSHQYKYSIKDYTVYTPYEIYEQQ